MRTKKKCPWYLFIPKEYGWLISDLYRSWIVNTFWCYWLFKFMRVFPDWEQKLTILFLGSVLLITVSVKCLQTFKKYG